MSNYKGKGKIVNYRESLKTQENALVKSEKADFSKSFHRNNEFLEVTYSLHTVPHCHSEERSDEESRPLFPRKRAKDEILRRESKVSLLSVQ